MSSDGDRNNQGSIRSRLVAGGVGFATAIILMAGIQARSGGSDDARPVTDSAASVQLVSVDPPSSLPPTNERTRPDCWPLVLEMTRREEAGDFQYQEYEELTPEQMNAQPLVLPLPRTDVAAFGERPEFADFGDALDIAALPDDRLERVVDRCWELGLTGG